MTVKQQPTQEEIQNVLTRGVEQIEKEADLRRLLLEGNQGQPLRIKLGVDPSHYDLTIGHAVVFRMRRRADHTERRGSWTRERLVSGGKPWSRHRRCGRVGVGSR